MSRDKCILFIRSIIKRKMNYYNKCKSLKVKKRLLKEINLYIQIHNFLII